MIFFWNETKRNVKKIIRSWNETERNDIFVKRNEPKRIKIITFLNPASFSNLIFGQMTLFQIFSVKRPFKKNCFRPNDFFGKMNFRSNGVRSNSVLVKWPFGQMVFGQTAFGQMAFRSIGVRSNGVRSNGVSVKWRLVKKNR
jgi:hypothetical protein